jgi:hypothetical protein
MNAGLIGRTQLLVEHGASALLGAAVAYAAYSAFGIAITDPQLGLIAATAGLGASILCWRVLSAIAKRRPRFAVQPFKLRELEPFIEHELILTDADRLNAELILTEADRLDSTEPLELDDILAEIGPESRVVRLFDRKAMPTAGQLRSRINHHLEATELSHAEVDASQALSDALAELRRSLR